MKKKHADKIRKEVVDVYSTIADDFSRTRNAPWLEFQHFLEYVVNNVKVLDLGCGNGRLFEFLKEHRVHYTGVDNNEALLKKAKRLHPTAHFEKGDMTSLTMKDDSFDMIFCIAAFHHLPGSELRHQSVQEMHRVLKKDGVVILTAWNLFQWKYRRNILQSVFSFLIHFGRKYAWNDLWIKWKTEKVRRYYHAFLPKELKSYFKKRQWKIEEFYFVRKGDKVKFWRAFNLILIARKK